MSKLHRRGYLAISTIAAASSLFVGAPAGVSAAAEEFSDGSTPGEAAVEPSGNSAQPAAPATTEWTPQGVDKGTSSGGVAPLVHGSSVGSGLVTEKAGSDKEASSYTPDSGGSYEPEPSVPATFEEPVSTPGAESGTHSVQPGTTATTTAAKPSSAVDVAASGAASLGHSAQPQGGGIGSVPAAAASFTDSGDRALTSSYALPLLVILMLGLILGFAGVRFRRRRQRRRLEALWREQDAVWEAALRRAELGQVAGDSEPSLQSLQQINVG
jgi:hypothetical protein